MFVVLKKSLYSIGTGATAQYAPRKVNRTEWGIIGPFRTRRAAERAVLACMRSQTLEAYYVDEATAEDRRNAQTPYDESAALLRAIKLLQAAAAATTDLTPNS